MVVEHDQIMELPIVSALWRFFVRIPCAFAFGSGIGVCSILTVKFFV
jgi:hypothetical protein